MGCSRLGLGAASAAAQYVVTHSQTAHNPINLAFLLDPLSKKRILILYFLILDRGGVFSLDKPFNRRPHLPYELPYG